MSLFPQPASRSNASLQKWAIASAAIHAAIFALFLGHHRAPVLTAVDKPGDKTGHYVTLSWNPGGAPHVAAVATTKVVPPQPTETPSFKAPSLKAPDPKPATESAKGGTQTGDTSDSLGDGEITLALTTNHPPPKPDLSALPHGTHGDVVVDIVIDPTGKIAKATLVRGLGAPIDGTVISTVQQWMFTPATRNGQPIASEQELLFHYDHA